MNPRPFITAALLALSLAACSTAGNPAPTPNPGTGGDNPPPSSNVQPFVAKGRVLDTHGKPLAGAKVMLDNTILYNSGQSVTTGPDGMYEFKLEYGSWRVLAQVTREYHGRKFKLDLHPDTYDSFAGPDGAVRNFVWKLSGEQPEPAVGYYGGSVYIRHDPNTEFYDIYGIEFTLTPQGPLIDGSEGSVIKGKPGGPNTKSYDRIEDVPIGRYTITGTYLPTGQAVLIRPVNQGEYATSVTADFEEELNYCRICMSFEVKLPE